jgi:hypothetical protein
VVHLSGASEEDVYISSGGRNSEVGSRYMVRIGKKRAGRLLDGALHDAMPGEG